jgi:hypothetical protein
MTTVDLNHFEWGLDDNFYLPSNPQPTLIDSDALVTTGLAGAGATRSGTNEVQTVTITGGPTGGSFTLNVPGYGGTGNIAWNANAAAVQTALQAVTSLSGNVTCAGGPLPATPVTCTFTGDLKEKTIAVMTTTNALTGGAGPTVTAAITTQPVMGAYDPGTAGNNVIRATLASAAIAVCSTGSQGHVGPRHIKARVYGTGTGPIFARLAWRVGADGGWSKTEWQELPGVGAFYELDLGTIQIPEALVGAQSWEGRIESYSATVGDQLEVDYVELLPAKRYGKARAPLILDTPTVFSARSEFTTESGAVTGDALAQGGSWAALAGSDTDDFNVSGGIMTRTATADSGTIVGGSIQGRAVGPNGVAALTRVAASLDMMITGTTDPNAGVNQGFITRYASAGNFLWVRLNPSLSNATFGTGLYAQLVIGGVFGAFPINVQNVPWRLGVSYRLQTAIYANGVVAIWYGQAGAPPQLIGVGQDPALATGGVLASGTTHVYDGYSGVAATRTYDNFALWVPETRPVMPANGGGLEVRHNAVVRSTGSRPPYEGAYLKLLPAGREGRGSQLAVKVRQTDVETTPDCQIADPVRVSLDVTPRVPLI